MRSQELRRREVHRASPSKGAAVDARPPESLIHHALPVQKCLLSMLIFLPTHSVMPAPITTARARLQQTLLLLVVSICAVADRICRGDAAQLVN